MLSYRNLDRRDEFEEAARQIYAEQGREAPVIEPSTQEYSDAPNLNAPSLIDAHFAAMDSSPTVAQAVSAFPAQQSDSGLGTSGLSAPSDEKWWSGETPTLAEYQAQLYRIKDTLTDDQFNSLAARIDAMKNDPTNGFYYNPYKDGATSPYIDAIAKLGIDVSGGINDEWIAKNQYLLRGARYTDAGTTPAAPTKTSTPAQNAAYYYYQLQKNWNDTKEVLHEEEELKKEIAYWVGRDDLNLSDQQILDSLDWNNKYKYLQGLKDAQSAGTGGKVYNYTQAIDYNPDYLQAYIWQARNGGGSGNIELDAVSAALGRGNVWQENKEISDKLDFKSDNFNPYQVKSTLDDAAQYFGVKSFEPGWAENVAKDINWDNPEEVKNWQLVYNAEKFTSQAESEAKTIKDRVDFLIASGITDPVEIEKGLWDKWGENDPALSALKKLDDSLVRPDKLVDTTRPINYSKKELEAYIADQCAKANSTDSLPAFGMRMTEMMGTNIVHPEGQMPAQMDPSATVAPTQATVESITGARPRDLMTPVPTEDVKPMPTPAPVAPTFTPTPGPSATPAPDARMVGLDGTAPTEAPAAAETTAQYNELVTRRDQLMQERENVQTRLAENELPLQQQKIVAKKKIDDLTKDLQTVQAEIDQISPASTPEPVTNQAEMAVNDAKTESIRKAAQIIWSMGTNDEKLVFSMAPVSNAENIAADMSDSVQNGVATASSLYSTSQKQANDFTASYYVGAKQAVAHYDEMQNDLAELNKQRGQLVSEINGIAMSRDAEQRAHLDGLQAQLTILDQNIAQQGKAISDFQMRYNQAQGELKTMNSMYDAAAAQLAMSENPGIDLSTPQGQQAMTEAKAKVRSLNNSVDLVMSVGSQYTPTEWAPNTVFQELEKNGYTTQEVAPYAQSIAAEADKKLAALNQAVEQMEASGMAIPGDWQGNVDRERARLAKQKQEAEDYQLKTNEDFAKTTDDFATDVFQATKNGERKYNSLTRDVVAWLVGSNDIPDAYFTSDGRKQQYDTVSNMSPDELKTYLYIADKEGEEAAYGYYQRILDNIQVRATISQNEELAKFAQDMPVLAAITSIGISPDTIKSAGYVAASLLSGQEINPYSRFFDSTWATGTLDQNAKETLLKPLQEGSFAKSIAGLGYDAVTSGAKSLLNSALTGPLAGGSAILSALPMGIQAAGVAAQQTKLQGGSDTQAALIAGVTLAAETLSETITTQNIAQAIDSGAKGVKGAMKKVLSNDMVEEFFGESINQLVESVADDVVMGELSQRNQRIKKYEETMSPDEAVRQADKDFWKDILAAGVTGALSSAGTSGISYVAGRLAATPSATVGTPEGQLRANMLANNGLPTDHTVNDRTARTVSMLTASLTANKPSQVQAVSAALFPVSGEAASQFAAISAGMRLSNQLGTEQAVALTQDVILSAAQEGADADTVKNAMTIAALGQGEASEILNKMNSNGIEFGDIKALVDAAVRDSLRPAVVKRMQNIVHNDRVTLRERALIGDGALAGVRPYEQAYSQAQAQEEQTQANLEAEQERAKAMGEHLQTVQAQHVEDPANPALAGAMKQAVKDVAGQVKVVGEYQQGLENQQQKKQDAEKDLNRVREEAMTKVREQAMADVQAEEQAEAQAAAEAQTAAEAAALAEAEAQAQEAQSPASSPNAGTVYTNDQVPVSYHWALVPASDLVTSNTDTGEANSAYPAELQPRDRTRAASQDQVAGMVRNLNPARLGESADAQNGAPIVGPDNVVESGNARTMAIRQAMASNPESAARYTQYVRDNAARFGLNPDDVTDNSVLVRVRDTDLDRVAFARAANESTTATYSPSENARSDAERLTPRMMEQFAPSDAGRLDNTENHAFALAFLNEIIPESERGAYMQDDGSISQQGYDRIRNAVFQRAYGSTALTQVLTEDTDGGSRNVMNALLKAAPRMMALQDAVSQGEVYDTGLPQKIAEAAQRYMELKNAGMNVETYLGQTVMPGFQTEDEATKSFMRLFEEYRRSGKKLAEALSSIADVVEEVGDPRAISFLGDVEVPSLPELIRQGVERMLRPRDLVSAYRTNGVKVSPSLTPQQQQAQQQNQNRNTGNVVSGQETIRQLTDDLGITRDARVKKFLRGLRRTAAGYTMNNGIIHTRDFQGAKVAMHEIGHNLDVRLGLQDMVNQMGPTKMAQLAQDYSANIDPDFLLQYSQAEIPEELMAEFSYVWATDRNQAVNWAGEDFVNQYERALQDHGWLKAMQTASEQMRRWADASGMDRAESMVRLEVPQKVQDKVNLNRARSIIADHTLPLQELADIVARASGNNQASANARELLLARPTLVKNLSDGNLYGTMLDMHGDVVRRADGTEYGSLADILENIDRKDEKAFNTYLLARLDIDRRAQGKGLFAEGIDSDTLVREYEAQYSNFRDVSDRLYEWYNKFFETWLVDTGIVPRAQFDAMRATAPHYVPLHAADESADRPSGKQRTDGNPARVLERAFESDASKYNPVMGLVENIEKYVMTAKTIEALRAFDAQMMYALENQLDVGAIAEPAQHDMERINQGRAKRNIADAVNRVLTGMQQNGTVSQQDSQAVMDAIANVANFDYVVHDTATGTDVINIPMADGEVHSWTIYNPDLLKALTMTNNNGNISPIARKLINGISTITRALSANVTSRSLKFSGQNIFSDVETAATTGRTGHNSVLADILAGARPVHMAKEIVAGLDLLRNKIADSALGEQMGLETSERYDAFKRFGMLGSRYAFRDSKTQKETRNALYGGHKSFGEAILDVVKSPLNFVEAVSGFGEEMTRYNAFALSGFDLSTYEGRLQAAKANREATTDFSKFGSGSDSEAFKIAKAAIPFINAQIQGIDKTLDTLHEIRNDPRRRAVLLGRVAINSLMMGAVTAAFRNIVWGDDEKESYEDLTDYEKTKFIHLFRWPDGTWFKMKRSQDMAVQAADLLGEYIGEVSSGYEGDAFSDLANGAVEIIKNGMVSTDTSLQPFFDALNNQTWYGSDIDTYNDKKMSPTARYGVDTSKFGRVVSTLTGGAITPKAVDYAVKQFMGSAGTLGTALLDTAVSSWDNKRFSGQALLNFLNDEVIGGYIVDPVYSNKVATTFYDGKEKLDFMQNEIKNGRTPEMFRNNLTQEEANKAAKELETMLSKGGAVYDANKQYSDIKKEYNAVMSDDTTLTSVQQAEKARELRHQMNVALLTANAAMGDFFNKYGYNSIFDQAAMNTMNILSGDTMKKVPDTNASSGSTDIRQDRVTTTNPTDDVRKNRTTKTDKEDVRKNRVNP